MARAAESITVHLDNANAALPDHIEAGIHLIPPHMRGALRRYLIHGIGGGSFLTALLSNDLMGALGEGDEENVASIRQWGRFIYNYMPTGSHGSPAKVNAWIESWPRRSISTARTRLTSPDRGRGGTRPRRG